MSPTKTSSSPVSFPDVWVGLGSMPQWEGVTADWTLHVGIATAALYEGRILVHMGRLASGHPCIRKPACGCHHVRRADSFVMVCDCDEPDCPDFIATEEQLRLHRLDTLRLAEAIRAVFSVKKPARKMPDFAGVFSLGTYLAPTQATYPVYLILPSFEDAHHADLARLANTVGKRFVAVLMTREALDPRMEAALASKIHFVFLSETVVLDKGGNLHLLPNVRDPLRAVDAAAPMELPDEEIARAMQAAFAMDDEKKRRAGPTMVQYLKAVAQNMGRNEIAKKYSCSPPQISGLKREFKARFKKDPEILLGRIYDVDRIAKTISDTRARHIDQRSAVSGSEEEFDR